MRSMILATVAVLVLAAPAMAQAPISTARASVAPQPTEGAPPLPEEDASAAQQGPQVAMGLCGPQKIKPDGTLETKPHGELEGTVGTGGYRSVGGYVCQPVGQHAAVAVGVSQTQMDGYHHR
jgi:hypothetical protein